MRNLYNDLKELKLLILKKEVTDKLSMNWIAGIQYDSDRINDLKLIEEDEIEDESISSEIINLFNKDDDRQTSIMKLEDITVEIYKLNEEIEDSCWSEEIEFSQFRTKFIYFEDVIKKTKSSILNDIQERKKSS